MRPASVALFPRQNLAAATRLELVSSRLQDERSVSQLSYAAIWWTGRDSNPHKKFAGLLCCRLHHQPEEFIICHWTFFIYSPRVGRVRQCRLEILKMAKW